MKTKELIKNLTEVKQYSQGSKLRKLLRRPVRYIKAISHRLIIYPFTKEPILVESETFFGEQMRLLLPSSTDIYLTKGKAHPSEIRLARFMIENLHQGDSFIDVGAHYGYFTLLASVLVGENGNVWAFEPTPETYKILHANVKHLPQTTAYNYAITENEGVSTFYTFPNLYAEYNSFHIEQYEEQSWYADAPPTEVYIPIKKLDSLVSNGEMRPQMIKIDVEGGESEVLNGMSHLLSNYNLTVILEYVYTEENQKNYLASSKLLKKHGYVPHAINENGKLQLLQDASSYMRQNDYDSENIVFKRIMTI